MHFSVFFFSWYFIHFMSFWHAIYIIIWMHNVVRQTRGGRQLKKAKRKAINISSIYKFIFIQIEGKRFKWKVLFTLEWHKQTMCMKTEERYRGIYLCASIFSSFSLRLPNGRRKINTLHCHNTHSWIQPEFIFEAALTLMCLTSVVMNLKKGNLTFFKFTYN